MIIKTDGFLDGSSLAQACFDSWIKTGYRDTSNMRQGEYLFGILEKQQHDSEKRCLLVRNERGRTHRTRLMEILAMLTCFSESDMTSPLGIAKQFAIILNDESTRFSPHVTTDKEFVINKSDYKTVLELLWWLYEVQNKRELGTKIELSVVCENLSVDDLYETAAEYDNQVRNHGSFPAYVTYMLGDNAVVRYTTPGDLEAESALPRPPELSWSEHQSPNELCHYDHVFAHTQFGQLRIEWKEHKTPKAYSCLFPFGDEAFNPDIGLLILNSNTLEEAKAKAYEFYTYYIRLALGHSVRKPRV